jgi:hypothetical protein
MRQEIKNKTNYNCIFKSFFFFSIVVILKMYSIRREPNNSRYEIMNCIRQQQQLIFNNRQMIKTKQHFFWSTKFYDHTDRSRDILPVYRTPCTFQETRKGTL